MGDCFTWLAALIFSDLKYKRRFNPFSLSGLLYACMFKIINFSVGDTAFNVIALFHSRITVVCEDGVRKS